MMLHLYFGRRFLQSFARVLAVLAILIFVIEALENIRGLTQYGVSFAQALNLAATSTPILVLRVLPLIVVVSSLAFCIGLARSNEFVISRAAGISALKSMSAPCLFAFLLGGFAVAFLNPLAATFSTKYDALKAVYTNSGKTAVSFGRDGFWLRQKDKIGHTVIYAKGTTRRGTGLHLATALKFDADGNVVSRLVSRTAILSQNQWIFTNGKIWRIDRDTENPESTSETFEILRFPTDITPEQVLEGYPKPSSVAIWDLPGTIATIRSAGVSALPHIIHLNIELARPLMLIAMTIIGAVFTLQNERLGNLGISVFLALLSGFSLYFLQNLAMTLGEAGEIPVFAATWAPPLAAILLALGLFLKFEDG